VRSEPKQTWINHNEGIIAGFDMKGSHVEGGRASRLQENKKSQEYACSNIPAQEGDVCQLGRQVDVALSVCEDTDFSVEVHCKELEGPR
jgi:hypothetical protein